MSIASRSNLIWQVLARFGTGAVVMGLLFFLSTRTLQFWHAWVFMAILFIPMAW